MLSHTWKNVQYHQGNTNQKHNELSPPNLYEYLSPKEINVGCTESGILTHGWWECESAQPIRKAMWRVL